MIEPPRTKEAARKFRYFRWGGNPNGTAYDSKRCAYQVWVPGRGSFAHQCNRTPGFGPDELYCKQHAKYVGAGEENLG